MGSLNTTIGTVDGFLGIRNALRPERQPKNALAEAENVVLLDDGSVEGRIGYTQSLSLTNVTDAYEHKNLSYAIVVANGSILAVDPALGTKTLATGLTDTTFSWSQVEDRVIYAGKHDAGVIINGSSWMPLRFPTTPTPNASVTTGSMYAGNYGFMAVLRHVATGLEGPASYPTYKELTSTGGFLVSLSVPTGYEADIYVTAANDNSFQYLATTTSTLIYNTSALNLKQEVEDYQVNTYPLPDDVNALAVHETCLWVGSYDQNSNTSIISYSQPYFYHIFDLSKEGFAVIGKVIQMLSVNEGLLIATDAGIWLRDQQENLVRIADYGVVPGKPLYKDQDGHVIIWTKRGLATFPPYKNVFDKKLSVAPGLNCAAVIVDIKGSRYSFVMTDTGGTPYNTY